MPRKFLQPPKKFVSRTGACRALGLSPEDFATLAVLLDVTPASHKQRQCIDHLDPVFFRIADVQRMADSELLGDIRRRNRLAAQRAQYPALQRYRRDVRIDYGRLAAGRYPTFGEAVRGLPFSLKVLHVQRRLRELAGDQAPCGGSAAIARLYRVLQARRALRKALIGQTGFFLAAEILGGRAEWFVPFRLEAARESAVLATLHPLCAAHVDLVAGHLEAHAPETGARSNALDGMVFRVDSAHYGDVYGLVVASCGGRVADTGHGYVVADGEVACPEAGVAHLQPQFVFDALNAGAAPDAAQYAVGSRLPPHPTPFREERVAVDADELLTLSRGAQMRLGRG